MYRVLKPTGSFYLHCDYHADSYIQVYILDKIFGKQNLKNQIIWNYKSGGASKNYFARKHDTIFFYTKSNKYTFNNIKEKSYMREKSGKNPKQTYYADNKGSYTIVNVKDVWHDIGMLATSAIERLGYPTQKPEALIERIIKASSNKGDVVLDCMSGGGTTIAVANKLGRKWVGIDQSVQAIAVSENRLNRQAGMLDTGKQLDFYSEPFLVKLQKYDYDVLRYSNAFEFEHFIVDKVNAKRNAKQVGDMGIDGIAHDKIPLQIKRSDNIGRNVIDNFLSACKRYDTNLFNRQLKDNKSIGRIFAFSFGSGAYKEVARLKIENKINIELIKISDIVQMAKKPKLKITVNKLSNDKNGVEFEFIASVQEPETLEFFSWDFNLKTNIKNKPMFKASILIDKKGYQKKILNAGTYQIACRALDKSGFKSIEIVKIKINGGIQITDKFTDNKKCLTV